MRKYKLVNILCELLGYPAGASPKRRNKQLPKTLRGLCIQVMRAKVPKAALNVVFAAQMFEGVRTEWQLFRIHLKIHELEEPDTWYSQPIVDNGQILFIFFRQ